MGRRKHQFFWHVSDEAWDSGAPINAGITNTGKDIILVLVDTEEPLAAEPVVPEDDNFVVERIIGQWHCRGELATSTNFYIHERVYVTQATAGAISVRDLATASEADTSFLYSQVTPWLSSWNNDTWGDWQTSRSLDDSAHTAGRFGGNFRDIQVGRRIKEGEALIYHWQFQGTIVPGDAEFSIKPWFRVLLRQG